MMRTYKHPGVHWLGMAWISLSVTQSWEVYNHSVTLQSGQQFLAHSYKIALLPCKDFATTVTCIYVNVLFKINSSLCSLGLRSQWTPLSSCTLQSLELLHRRRKELAGFGGLSMEIRCEKTYASHKSETSWSNRVEKANTQSQCQSADQNDLPLVKEAALVPPLPLLGQSQDKPFWVSLGIRYRNVGNDRKVDGQGLQPCFTKMEDVCVGQTFIPWKQIQECPYI